MREACSVWPASSNRRAPGRTSGRRYARRLTNPASFANKGNGLSDRFRRPCPETRTVSQSDPTDSALAAIASILDQPQSPPDKPPVEEPPAVPQPVEAHGYSKVGPGPMAAIRFKWAAREDNGHYYVDEAVGA